MSDSLKVISLRFKSSFGEDAFIIQKATAEEFLSDTYVINVNAYTNDESFDGDDLINQEAAVIFEIYNEDSGADDKKNQREFHGIITHMEHVKSVTDTENQVLHYFHMQLRPSFWMLKHGSDYRIFQNKSAIEIINAIFEDQAITNFEIKASGGKTVREYCVQYGETHFNFVSRLLEEEGIGYYFTHKDSSHTMVLFDKNTDFQTIPQSSLNFTEHYSDDIFVDSIYQFGKKTQIMPKAYKALDFNYTTPHTQLLSSSSGDGFGAEIYEYPGLFTKSGQGSKLAESRIEEIEWFTKQAYGKSTAATLSPGYTFSLKKHPLKAYNTEYAISYTKHEMASNIDNNINDTSENLEFTYQNNFEGFAKSIHYRPLRKTKKPHIYGSQTAFVTGSGTEVYGDDMARIKIKFHWDLLGEDDETSSLWVRVSQSLSGATWGALYMPRIGMEVVVSFIDGDPDRPIVTGCVYNKSFMPPYSPKSKPHYMSLKSKTFDDDSGFNEFRFSDKPGKEEIYTHAQYDMNTVIEHSRDEKINTGNDTLTIGEGNKKVHQKGDGTTYLTLIDSGNRTIKLKDGNLVIDVKGTILIKASDDITIKTPTNIIMKAGENITMKAGENIKAKAGSDITAKAGSEINAKAGTAFSMKAGTELTAKAGTELTAKAGTELTAKAGTDLNIKAGANLNVKAAVNAIVKVDTAMTVKVPTMTVKADTMIGFQAATMMIKTDAMLQVQSDAAVMMKAGAAMILKSDAALVAEGGAVGAFKGAITKLG